MRAPAAAILWETWRLSRLRLAVMVFLATFGGAALIVSPADAAWSASRALMLAGATAWLSHAWTINVDSRTGFSMALGFARPIPTWVLVSVPMAYVGVTCAAAYLIPVLVLRTAFGVALPLLPVAALLCTLSLVYIASYWWTQNAALRTVGRLGLIALAFLWYLGKRTGENDLSPDRWPDLFSFSAWAYVGMALISVAAIGLTIAAVAGQRHGDDPFTLALRAGRSAGAPALIAFRTWIADRLRMPCPTTSPTRAQLWFEVQTVGGRVLATGLLIALAAPVALTIAEAAGSRGGILVVWMLWTFLPPLIVGLRSLLGVRRKQGISYLSAFTATRAMGTGRLIGLKVLVTSVAMIGAWAAIGASLWFFAVRHALWGREAQAGLADYLPSLPPSAEAALSSVASVLVYVTAGVACAGAFQTLLLLNRKRVVLAGLGIAFYIACLVALGIRGWIDGGATATLHVYIVTSAAYLGTIYVFRRALAERLITRRGFIGVLAFSVPALWTAVTAMTWLGQNAEAPYLDEVVTVVTLALMLVATIPLAPWAFSRIRHQ